MNAPRARAFVGLGSNLDDPAAQLRRAFEALEAIDGVHAVRRSRLYRTPPWGRVDQPDFVNAVAELDTTLAPHALLLELQALEARFGRARREHWGPRVLDLDLLLHGDGEIRDAGLQLPHPHLHERAFVHGAAGRNRAGRGDVPGRGSGARLHRRGWKRAGIEALGG
ncbi:MAG: 2-amino-4-hydroxy-6-hydroxymethyldihydropteridine diphosphokinase [Chiayiivirga sp.]|jgi:2-amino-4-hydroxy-6-hydroxymethyldihydropteridine diphosphokinase|nr:2-amino-4-hydroxy-6-hydroxymethyldihydropteridine diphosphokinase [Chiayiivirga sp.]